ncbi:hypothetical protein QR98_0091060 [Sarcoptes scabiei]|uniref:Uncharacterized protein n=1 Tax=Sarcoptes scabiei TaxID=52283 RepID=A0A132AHS1_SARSC|nr:hypothetical protein QR98_0091060 [Sarcoptes scabiei]
MKFNWIQEGKNLKFFSKKILIQKNNYLYCLKVSDYKAILLLNRDENFDEDA